MMSLGMVGNHNQPSASAVSYDIEMSAIEPAAPELLLSDLMMQSLHLYVAPDELRAFVRDNWRLLSVYAHRIHGGV